MFQNISMCVIKCKHYKIIIVTKLSKISAPFYVNSKNYQHLSKILKDCDDANYYVDNLFWLWFMNICQIFNLFFKTKWITKQAFGQFDPYFCHQRIERCIVSNPGIQRKPQICPNICIKVVPMHTLSERIEKYGLSISSNRLVASYYSSCCV